MSGSDWREVQEVVAENNALRHQLSMIEIKRIDDKLADDLRMVAAREQRIEADRQTEELRIREDCRRGCWREAAITSQIGTGMVDSEVFQPDRIEKYAEQQMATGLWPKGADQEREYSTLWQHVAPSTERHSSLGPSDDDLSPLERKLKALLQ
jgi:hypothetical protein